MQFTNKFPNRTGYFWAKHIYTNPNIMDAHQYNQPFIIEIRQNRDNKYDIWFIGWDIPEDELFGVLYGDEIMRPE